MKFVFFHVFLFLVSFSFAQKNLFGKYDSSVGSTTFDLKSDSTYAVKTINCLGFINKAGFWSVSNDYIHTYYYQLNPISLEFDSVKIYTDTLWINRKRDQLYLIIDKSKNIVLPFERISNTDFIYLEAVINGFNRHFKPNVFDYIELINIENKKEQYELKSCTVQFLNEEKIFFKTILKGNQFTDKIRNQSLKLKTGDKILLSNFIILKNNKKLKNVRLKSETYTIN